MRRELSFDFGSEIEWTPVGCQSESGIFADCSSQPIKSFE